MVGLFPLYPEEMLDYSLERNMCIPGILDDMRMEEDYLHQRKQRDSSVEIAGKDRSAAEDAEGWNGMLGQTGPQSMTNCTGALGGKDQELLMTSLAAKDNSTESLGEHPAMDSTTAWRGGCMKLSVGSTVDLGSYTRHHTPLAATVR